MKSSGGARGKVPKRTPSKQTQQFASLLLSESQLIAMVCLVIVVFICYVNSLGNEFVFDDNYLVVRNPEIESLNLSLLWNSYRPMRNVSYALDLALWGKKAFGFHLTNIVLHAANVLLVFGLVRRFTKDLMVATLAALIFAVHPMQTDAVTYISGRRDLLFGFFYLLAMHAYLSYDRTRWSIRGAIYFTLFLVSWGLSLLSKEMALSLPILIFVWQYSVAWDRGTSWWRQSLTAGRLALAREKWLWLLLFVGALAFAYRGLARGGSTRATLSRLEYWGGSFYLNFLTVIRVHAWYLKQLLFPTPIAQYLGAFDVSTTIFDWSFAVSLLVVGSAIGAGLLLLNRQRLMAFAILAYFVLLLPVSHIIPHHELLADHYLYLPMMAFGLLVALVVRRLTDVSDVVGKVGYLIVAAAVIALAVTTILHNRTWKNERTLWTANYKAVPNSPRAALNLGDTYQNSEPEKAEVLFKRALLLNPPPYIRRTLHDRLAVILIKQGKYSEAEYFVSDLLSRSPNDFFANLWSSQIFTYKKDCEKARPALIQAQSLATQPRERIKVDTTRQQFEKQCGK